MPRLNESVSVLCTHVLYLLSLLAAHRMTIAAYVFAQYFFLGWLVGWLLYAVKVAGTVAHLGDLVLGLRVSPGSGGRLPC